MTAENDKNILVVDDSSFIRMAVKKELEPDGYKIIEAEDGREALEKFSENEIALVTMDVEMPNLDGYQACREIRSEKHDKSDRAKTPVIFLTGSDTLEGREQGFEAGAADFIIKPFLQGELLSSVNRILEPSHMFEGMKVLVVDDSATVRFVVRDILVHLGLEVVEKENGQTAFDFLAGRKEPVDLIITDIVMPEMNGDELCKKIRYDLNMMEVPIFFLTSIPERSYLLNMFKIGATDYLPKPFVREELIARLNVHLSNRLVNKELNRKVYELKRLNQLKEDFLAICSHDFRSPLTSILGFADLLLFNDKLDKAVRTSVEHIKSSGESLLDLINEILDLSAIQSETDLTLEPVELAPLAKARLKGFSIFAGNKNIKLIMNDSLPPETRLMAHSSSMSRVLNNLLSNAVKFTSKGGTISLSLEMVNPETLALTVRDSGIGIPEETLPKLFDKLAKTSRKGTAGESGTGLGLPITKELVEKQKGTIRAASEPRKGTTFELQFPITQEEVSDNDGD